MPELIPVDHDPFNDPPTNLIPVDHDPFASLGAQPKEGQTVAPQNVQTDIASLPPKVAGTVGDMLGLTDAAKALRGEMTPEEAEKFALYAAAGLVTPEMRAARAAMNAAEKVAPEATANALADFRQYWNDQGIRHFIADRPQREQFQLSDLVVPKEQRGQGIGTQFMNGLTGLADKNGRTITLSPTTDYGATSMSRLKDFYKQFGFVENKGRNKDFTISDSMYRLPQTPPEAPQPQGIRAYHGSPYDFDKFDISKIGTGEGAQVYGHGLYFAENPATAKAYRDTLAPLVNPQPAEEQIAADAIERFGSRERAIQELQDVVKRREAGEQPPKNSGTYFPYHDEASMAVDLLKSDWQPKTPGKMYEVNINADPEHFLDWDKPLSEQSPKVQEVLREHGVDPKTYTLGAAFNKLGGGRTNAAMARGKTLNASEQLREAGIPGIKYLDQGSRATPTHIQSLQTAFERAKARGDEGVAKNLQAQLDSYANGTHNYVVFSHDIIDIIKKYGLAGLIAGGAAHYQTTPVDHDPFE